MNWFRKIIATWKDAAHIPKGERPYVMDEIFKPSSWKIIGGYVVVMCVVLTVLALVNNDTFSEWVGLPLVVGFGLVLQTLIQDKILFGTSIKPTRSSAEMEVSPKEHSHENQSAKGQRQIH
jgi:hypothetical protein